MSQVTIEPVAADFGDLGDHDATLATAQDGTGTYDFIDSNADSFYGENSVIAAVYYVQQSFLNIDLSGLSGPATAVTFRAWPSSYNNVDDLILEMYEYDAGAAISEVDWRTRAWLQSATLLASFAVAGTDSVPGTYVNFTSTAAFLAAVNAHRPGVLPVVFALNQNRLGSTPTGTNYLRFDGTDFPSSHPSQIIIDYGAASLAGNQPAASGALIRTRLVSLAGNQPASTGGLPTILKRLGGGGGKDPASVALPLRPRRGSIRTKRNGTL